MARPTKNAHAEESGREHSAYRALSREIRTAILKNQYEGVRLPTEAELVAEHGVSRQTVRRAMQELVAEGMINRIPGRGTFVAERDSRYLRQLGSIEDLMAIRSDTELDLIAPLQYAIDLEAARALRLDSDRVMITSFVRLYGGAPLCVTKVALAPEVGEELLNEHGFKPTELGEANFTVVGALDQTAHGPVTEADQSITAAPIPASIAGHLRCSPDHPGLRIDRIYYNARQEPLEFSVSYFLPEMYSYRVRLHRTSPS